MQKWNASSESLKVKNPFAGAVFSIAIFLYTLSWQNNTRKLDGKAL